MSNPNPIPAILFLAACLTFAPNAPAEPQIFSDDFQTATTYNHDSLLNSCAATTKPKWSVANILDGVTYYERLISGGGKLVLSNWGLLSHNPGVSNLHRMEIAYVGRTGQVCTNPPYSPFPEPLGGTSNLAFTHDDLCILGGFQFNRFQLTTQNLPKATGPVNPFDANPDMHWGLQYGPDGAPGIAGMDDDGDGSTDNDPNCNYGEDDCPGDCNFDDDENGTTDDPSDAFGLDPSTGNPIGCNQNNNQGTDDSLFTSASSFQRVAEYLATGPDGCPGNCGVDDDGNGITDVTDVPAANLRGIDDDGDGSIDEPFEVAGFQPDLPEIGWPSTDDSDDISGEQGLIITMRALNIAPPFGDFVGVLVNPANAPTQFALMNSIDSYTFTFEDQSELSSGFYTKDTRYNYSFCAEGTSYSAQLWIGDDMANPVQTLGPEIITGHDYKNFDKHVGIVVFQDQHGILTPVQNVEIRGNQNFCDSFWVVENATLSSLPDELLDPDGDALPNHCDLCDEVFNPVHDAVFDCNRDGKTSTDPQSSDYRQDEQPGEQCDYCNFCATDTNDAYECDTCP